MGVLRDRVTLPFSLSNVYHRKHHSIRLNACQGVNNSKNYEFSGQMPKLDGRRNRHASIAGGPMVQNSRLAGWLKDRIRESNLTQNEIARQSGVSSATLSAVRHGHTPTAETIALLAAYFNTDRESLLEMAGIISPLSDLPTEVPEETRALLRRLNKLPERDREEVLRLMESFLMFVESRPSLEVPEHGPDGSVPHNGPS
jgi:transcriptional regulator with XRE-family HTH domain